MSHIKVRLREDLVQRATQAAAAGGFASGEEFIELAVEQALTRAAAEAARKQAQPPAGAPGAADAAAREDVVRRMKGLGYLVTDAPVVLGLDPGLGITGYGAIRPGPGQTARLVEAGVLRTDDKLPLALRLAALFDGLGQVLADLQPTAVVVEEVFSHVEFPKTAIVMGHARGVLLLAAGRLGIAVHEYAPARVKMAVGGHGRATKENVAAAVARALGLATPPSPADVTDALAIAICHAWRSG